MPYVSHKNGQRSFYVLDDFTDPWCPAETILIQHGFARSSAFWYHWVPALARHYRVIRRDSRGHGKSSEPPSDGSYDYSVDTFLAEIVDTLDQLGVTKVHYLGESTGGIFREALAVKYPDRLLSLTTCSSPMLLPPAAQDLLAFGHKTFPQACRQLGSRGWGMECLKLLGTDQIEDKGYAQWWLEQVSMPSGTALADHAELLCKVDARDFVEQIKVPMLILAPQNSKLATVEGQEELHGKVEGSQMVVIDGKGHEIYIDKPEQCQKAFLEFLAGLKRQIMVRIVLQSVRL